MDPRPPRANAAAPMRAPGNPKAEEASVRTDASSGGGEDGRGLFRGWCEVYCGAVRFPPCAPEFPDDGREGLVGDGGGKAENVIEPADGPEECVRMCGGIRCPGVVGVGGACAIWAMPPLRSTLKRVVGLVLAVILRNVRECDRYEDESRDGDGDGGALGGMGRTEASSSASK